MPTKREREYYRMGYRDGISEGRREVAIEEFGERAVGPREPRYIEGTRIGDVFKEPKRKRKLSAWNKYVKANSKKPRFRYRNGKLNLKKMAIAFRKTPQGKKSKRR
jgi:hypothetical protein